MERRLSDTIELLRFPLMVGVVLVHCMPVGWLGTALTSVLGQTCVPTFFVISGYLFYGHLVERWSWQTYIDKMKKRVWSLLIPYIIWNMLLALFICRHQIMHFDWHGVLTFFTERGCLSVLLAYWHPDTPLWWGALSDGSPTEFLGWWQPLNIPLWYVRDLMLFCAASPVIYFLMKGKRGHVVLALMLILMLACGGWFPMRGLFFFYMGAYCRFHDFSLSSLRYGRAWIWSASALLFVPALIASHYNSLWASLFVPLFLVLMPATWFLLADWGIEHRGWQANALYTKSCFLILVIHFRPTLAYADEAAKHLLDYLPLGSLNDSLCYLLAPYLAIIGCVYLYMLLNMVMPRTLAFMTGGHA